MIRAKAVLIDPRQRFIIESHGITGHHWASDDDNMLLFKFSEFTKCFQNLNLNIVAS